MSNVPGMPGQLQMPDRSRMSFWGFLDAQLDRTERFAGHVQSTLQTGRQAKLALASFDALTTVLWGVANSQLVKDLKDLVKRAADDELEQRREGDVLDPVEAAAAANRLLAVYDSLKRQGNETLILARDPRWRRHMRLPWEPGLEMRLLPSDLLDHVVGLAGAFGMMTRGTRVAWEKLFQMHGARAIYLNQADREAIARMGDLSVLRTDIPLPRHPYRSEAQKVHDLAWRLLWWGDRLVKRAEAGEQRLRRASLGPVAYDPSAVVKEAVQLATSLPALIFTCAEIGDLAIGPVGRACHDIPPGDAPPPALPSAN